MYTRFFLAVPQNLKIAAKQFYGNRLVFIYQSVKGGCNSDCTGTCTTGKCLAGTAFPDTHLECMAVNDFYKLGIDTIREINVIFEFRTEFFDVKVFSSSMYTIACGFPNRDSSDMVSFAIHMQRFIDYLFFGRNNRNLSGSQNRCAHY